MSEAQEPSKTDDGQSRLTVGLGGWQPITTAPNEQDLLLAGTLDHADDWRIKIGHRDTEAWYGFYIYGASWEPRYWMPLPATPN